MIRKWNQRTHVGRSLPELDAWPRIEELCSIGRAGRSCKVEVAGYPGMKRQRR